MKNAALTFLALSLVIQIGSVNAQEAQDETSSAERELAEKWAAGVRLHLETQIAAKVIELTEMKSQLGAAHPQMAQLQAQIAALKAELAKSITSPHANQESTPLVTAAAAMKSRMRQFGDTMESLSKQIEAIEKLENQLHSDTLPSRDEFFKSAEAMFVASQKYFIELETYLQDEVGGTSVMTDLRMAEQANKALQIAQQRQKLVEIQQQIEQQMQVTQARRAQQVADFIQAAQANQELAQQSLQQQQNMTDDSNNQDGRLTLMEQRLTRIEQMLKKALGNLDSGNDDSDK